MKVMDRFQSAHSLYAVDIRIDQLCDEFESAWQRGERPDIVHFIERADESHRDRFFYQLLLVELEYRIGRGECPSRADYTREFSQFAEVIEAAPFSYASPVCFDGACQ